MALVALAALLLLLLAPAIVWIANVSVIYFSYKRKGRYMTWREVTARAAEVGGTLVVNDSGYKGNGTWWSPNALTDSQFINDECILYRTICPKRERDTTKLAKAFPKCRILHVSPLFA